MLRLKPTTIFSLDASSAAFCQAVRNRLERSYGVRGSLIQIHAVVRDHEGVRFEADLARVAATRVDVVTPGTAGMAVPPQTAWERPLQKLGQSLAKILRTGGGVDETESFWEQSLQKIEPLLVKMLRTGRSFDEIQAAQRSGFQIVDERVIYFVLATFEPANALAITHLARLVKWLLAKRLAGEVCTMHAVILLPDLLEHPTDAQLAATYAMLKRLDDLTANGVDIGSGQKIPPFDTYWLMDGVNAQAVTLGSLEKNMDGYADAFAGLLSAEPERSGPVPGRHSRGKVPACNSFGFGELYLPSEVVLTRLSAALARDILRTAFLSEGVRHGGNRRPTLLAAKQFVLGKSYADQVHGLERDAGAPIWRDFRPRTVFSGDPHAYMHALRTEQDEFERHDLLAMRESLENSRGVVAAAVLQLIDAELDQLIDSAPDGFREAADLLDALQDPDVALDRGILGDNPLNLATEFASARVGLDQQLGVSVDGQATRTLLEQVDEVRTEMKRIDRDLRMRGDTEAANGEGRRTASLPSGGVPQREKSSAGGDVSAELQKQRDDAEARLLDLSDRYRHEAAAEERAAEGARQEARKTVVEQRAAAVGAAETRLVEATEQLRLALREVEDRQAACHGFRRGCAAYLFAAFILLYGVPTLLDLIGFGAARGYIAGIWANLWNVLLWTVITVAVYAAVVGAIYWSTVHKKLIEARGIRDARLLEQGAGVSQLERARNAQLKLKFELDAHERRKELFDQLIGAVRGRTEEIRNSLRFVESICANLDGLSRASSPEASTTRRPLLTSADIDAYYAKAVPDVNTEAHAFMRDVKRSAVRKLPAEEFRTRLTTFAWGRFADVAQLSIEDALLQRGQLVLLSAETARRRLQELNDAAAPLVRLQRTDVANDAFAQTDVTLWVSPEHQDPILSLYRKICPEVTTRAAVNGGSLRVLSRCLHFPAYFLAAIEHYRECYERTEARDAVELPDLLPLDPEVQRVHEQLLLGIALDVVFRGEDGGYAFVKGAREQLGRSRQEVVENLTTKYAFKRHASELTRIVKERTSDRASVRQQLLDLLASPGDLDEAERRTVDSLAQKFHPLR